MLRCKRFMPAWCIHPRTIPFLFRNVLPSTWGASKHSASSREIAVRSRSLISSLPPSTIPANPEFPQKLLGNLWTADGRRKLKHKPLLGIRSCGSGVGVNGGSARCDGILGGGRGVGAGREGDESDRQGGTSGDMFQGRGGTKGVGERNEALGGECEAEPRYLGIKLG